MDDLDKKIKSILNQPPVVPPPTEGWQQLQRRLHQPAPFSPRVVGGWWWLLLLPLLGIGGGLVYYIQSLNTRMQQLEQHQIVAQQQQQQQLVVDTIYQTTVIYDTLYRSVTVPRTTIPIAAAQSQRLPIFNFPLWGTNLRSAENGAVTTTTLSPLTSAYFGQRLGRVEETKPPVAEIDPWADLPIAAVATVDLLPLDNATRSLPNDLPELPFPAAPRVNPLLYMQPTGAALAGGVGYLSDFGVVAQDRERGINLQLQGELTFGKNLALFSGLEYMSLNYKVEDDPVRFAVYPLIESDVETDVLHEIKVNLQYLQIPLGMKYYFNPEGRFRPLVGAAVVAHRPLEQQFKYGFLGMFEEYYLDRRFAKSAFRLTSYRFMAGATYQWNDHWGLQFMADYQHDAQERNFNFEPTRYLGIKGNLIYNF